MKNTALGFCYHFMAQCSAACKQGGVWTSPQCTIIIKLLENHLVGGWWTMLKFHSITEVVAGGMGSAQR